MSCLLENGLKSVNPRGYQGSQGWLWWALTETVPARAGEERVRIDSTQLAMILGGVRLETAERRKRYHRRLV